MKIISKNKYVKLNYDIEDSFDAGIILKWYEVKSIKTWKINIKDAIVRISNNELFIVNMDIPLYPKSSISIVKNYESKWRRKLLVTKRQLSRLAWKTTKTWLVLIPLYIYENKKRLIKISIWLWKLRRKIEKKQIIKNRDIKREMDREIKSYK